MDEFDIMEGLRDLHPWLVRVWVDDKQFAYITNHILFCVPKQDVEQNTSKFDDMIFMVSEGNKLHIPPSSTAICPISGYIFLWLRYQSVTNRKLYRLIISHCYNKETILSTPQKKLDYIKAHMRGLELMGYEIDDVYNILKGYLDTIETIAPLMDNIIEQHYPKHIKETLKLLADKYRKTQKDFNLKNKNDIAELIMRDYTLGERVHILP